MGHGSYPPSFQSTLTWAAFHWSESSLIATSKRLALDPFAYLRDLFGRISSHPKSGLAELLPGQRKTGRESAENS
jgi:IS66 C-terminal element